jgi:hypothetical protein
MIIIVDRQLFQVGKNRLICAVFSKEKLAIKLAVN